MLLVFSVLSSLIVFSEPASGHGAEAVEEVPSGIVQARLAGLPALRSLNAMLLEGVRQGVMLSWQGEQPLVVLGQRGEPMLRFSERGVEANAASATWQRVRDSASKAESAENWQLVSRSRSFGWMDPRLTLQDGQPSAGSEALGQWRIPMQTGDRSVDLAGVFYWRSLPAAMAGLQDRH